MTEVGQADAQMLQSSSCATYLPASNLKASVQTTCHTSDNKQQPMPAK
jgi:hypothetical protein